MVEKTQTWQEYFADKTDEQLIGEAGGLDQMINELDCFGTHDLIRLDAITAELDRRGYKAVRGTTFIKKEGV